MRAMAKAVAPAKVNASEKSDDLERVSVGIVSQSQSVSRTQRGDLCQGQIDENDFPGDDMNSKINVVDREHKTGEKGNQHPFQFEHGRHDLFF